MPCNRELSGELFVLALVLFGFMKLSGALLVMFFIDSWGRRPPLLAGLTAMFVFW